MPYRAARPLLLASLAVLALPATLAVMPPATAADLDLRPTRDEPAHHDTVRLVPQGARVSGGVAIEGGAAVGGALRIGDTTIGAGIAAGGGVAVRGEVSGTLQGDIAGGAGFDAGAGAGRRKGDVPIAVVPPGNLPPVAVPNLRPVVEAFEDEVEVPAPLPRSTLRFSPATPDSSFVRIGRSTDQPRVADGRVDLPTPRPGSAGQLPGGGDTEGGIVVVRQELEDLITQVARFYGFDAVLTRQVRGQVENEELPSELNAFIERLTTDRDLVFYFRNRDLNVSARSENVSRVIGLGPSDPRELRAAIEAAGVDADRFPLRFIEASNSILVDGPPSFVALVEVIAESLVRTERNAPAVTVIRGNQIDRQSPGTEPAAAPNATVPPTQ